MHSDHIEREAHGIVEFVRSGAQAESAMKYQSHIYIHTYMECFQGSLKREAESHSFGHLKVHYSCTLWPPILCNLPFPGGTNNVVRGRELMWVWRWFQTTIVMV